MSGNGQEAEERQLVRIEDMSLEGTQLAYRLLAGKKNPPFLISLNYYGSSSRESGR
ncbi:hypothetical protein ACFLTV_00015 [Chloroflexota bacterium]